MGRRNAAAALLVAMLAVTGCGYVPRIPGVTPYRMDIQQGNYVSQEMVSQLKAGMSRDQVRFILGTPLLTDIFHADRWDYVYWREEGKSGKREERRLAVHFKDDRLVRVDGDVVPTQEAKEAK
jgi:outer membrane protein assembly factor BamE